MEFALYRYEFEVMEKKDSSASLFPNQWDNLTPREAFDRKSELLNELIEKDYQQLLAEQNKRVAARSLPLLAPIGAKSVLPFTNSRKKPLFHKYSSAPKDGFAILELARLTSVSHRPQPFLTNAVKEDDYKSLHIIIDNRGTYQRVAIEIKSSVFKETDIVAESLARALSDAFERYGLLVKVVPIRDDKHFWKVVNDRKQFPFGFKKLCVKFPQINDPKVTEDMRRANMIYREMFHSNLYIIQEPPLGESLHFDENDEKQREYIRICTENADSIKLSPIGGRTFTLGGKAAKTQMMTESERKSIEEGNRQQGLFDGNPAQSTKSFMDKAYGKA